MLLDILPEIFRNLSVADRLRCRQVCRAWRHVLGPGCFRELCLCLRVSFAPDVWYIDCEPIDTRSVLTVKHLNVLANPNFLRTFRGVRRLMIKGSNHECASKALEARLEEWKNLGQLDQLDRLEHLELRDLEVPYYLDLFNFKLNGLKKFYHRHYCGWSSHPFPKSLEAVAFSLIPADDVLSKLNDGLKVLISWHYSNLFLRLSNLQELHLGLLSDDEDDDQKPVVFLGRFPKLVLLTIRKIERDSDMNEILSELGTLKKTRKQSIKFFYNGFDISVFTNQRDPQATLSDQPYRGTIDVERLLSVASQNPELVLPFCFFRREFEFLKDPEAVSLSKPPPFEIVKSFQNIAEIYIKRGYTNYEHVRRVLVLIGKQISAFCIACDLNPALFELLDDLPKLLENLISLSISLDDSQETLLKSLKFLNGFKRLLQFEFRFEKNENNHQIIESIERRIRSMPYRFFSGGPYALNGFNLGCTNHYKK